MRTDHTSHDAFLFLVQFRPPAPFSNFAIVPLGVRAVRVKRFRSPHVILSKFCARLPDVRRCDAGGGCRQTTVWPFLLDGESCTSRRAAVIFIFEARSPPASKCGESAFLQESPHFESSAPLRNSPSLEDRPTTPIVGLSAGITCPAFWGIGDAFFIPRGG